MATELRYPMGYVFLDNSGDPLASGTVQYYEAGTTTDEPIYSDAAGATALPNPITLNSAGRAVDGASNLVAIYLSDAGATDYKEEVKDSGGTTIWTDDDIPVPVDLTASLSDTAKPRIQWATDTDAAVSLTAGNLGGGRLASSGSNNITYSPISASVAGNGNGYLIKKTNASNTVTFDPDGAETVDGGSTFAWTEDDRAYWFTSDGANWQVSLAYLANLNADDVTAVATDTAAGFIELANATEIATATDTSRALVAGLLSNHPLVPKAWAVIDNTGAIVERSGTSTPTSVENSTGNITVTWGVTFATSTYPVLATVVDSTVTRFITCSAQDTTTSTFLCANSGGTATDPTRWVVMAFGRLA